MKRVCLAVVMSLVSMVCPLSAQELAKTNTEPINFPEFVSSSFINYYTTGGVQEKLYVVTDKPYYSAGDTIYFSAFLVNSIYFNRTTDSRFLYAELIDATGNVVSRMKLIGSA